ncbi:hypothetical protein [Pinibacter aurantiacus]|uniref:Uncharacterized protein n=1 Tax=Pinibacter aurantiacus TaxID=2851599 RepID=A0A9E2S934_9BACT|nr:hypothetical protein [Pinibacter aurantiacus]MBV4357148.1 hypothetical protein [Pinibacter aurantiacus]
MEVVFKEISETEFLTQQITVLFTNKNGNRKFGIVSLSNRSYKFSWQSDLIEPVITKIADSICAVGVDQHFVIIDFEQNKLLLDLSLFYNFYDTKIWEEQIFVCTELEVLVVDKVAFRIVRSIDLPDFFERLVFEDKKIRIVCMGQLVVEQTL